MSSGRPAIAVTAAARKSRLRNALEGFALTAILQSFPTFAAASLLLKLCGSHELVGDHGVAIFVAFASLVHATIAVTLGPGFRALSKTLYEPNSSIAPCRSKSRSPNGAPTRSPRCNWSRSC